MVIHISPNKQQQEFFFFFKCGDMMKSLVNVFCLSWAGRGQGTQYLRLMGFERATEGGALWDSKVLHW